MKITIHRGTHQIGGVITEISTPNYKVFIDIGANLPGNEGVPLPQIDGLTIGNGSNSALFITHYHGDHLGSLDKALPEIRVFMGEVSKEIQIVKAHRLAYVDPDEKELLPRYEAAETFVSAKKISFGDIDITPFFVDHSAVDSYMFLIELEGKKILHTGDFRSHGYRGKGLIPTLEKYVGTVDILITEGTMLSRYAEQTVTEKEIKIKAEEYINQYKYVFFLCSSTNIDRIAAFYQATPRGRYFVCDSYQKDILNIVQEHQGKHTSLYSFESALVYSDNLLAKLQENGCCMLVRATSKFEEIMKKFDPRNTFVIYSMWEGYLADDNYNYNNFLKGYNWEYLHTSGHADRETLALVAKTVSPRLGILPMHSEAPDGFDSLNLPYKKIYLHDGEVLKI